MSRFHYYFSCFSCLLFSTALLGQNGLTAWEGRWSGTVHIWSYNIEVDSFPMSLEIIRRDSLWDYTITYDRAVQGQPDVRKYQLIEIDAEKQHYGIDEQNSIVLDTYLSDNCMRNRFSGMGSDLQMRLCLEQEKLHYEITSSFEQAIRVSGDTVIDQDTIPAIQSYDLYNVMKAKLKRVRVNK